MPDTIARRQPERRLRIWSAGCSHGEEAYSLAITCREEPALDGWDVRIMASDLSRAALVPTRVGRYRARALRYVDTPRLQSWFQPVNAGAQQGDSPSGAEFQVREEIKGMVSFVQHNLAALPYGPRFGGFDLLLCENVLIYFTPLVTQQVVQQLHGCLLPGGFLFVGYAENLWQVSDLFVPINTHATFFYRRPAFSGDPCQDTPAPASPTSGDLTCWPQQISVAIQPVDEAPAQISTEADEEQNAAPVLQLIKAARENLSAGRYLAAADFERAVQRYPQSAGAHLGLAQIHANRGRLSEAEHAALQALAIDPLREEAYLLLGLIYRRQARVEEAITQYEKVVYLNATSVAAHYYLAEIHRNQGRGDDADREYRSTLWAIDADGDAQTQTGLSLSLLRRLCEQYAVRKP